MRPGMRILGGIVENIPVDQSAVPGEVELSCADAPHRHADLLQIVARNTRWARPWRTSASIHSGRSFLSAGTK